MSYPKPAGSADELPKSYEAAERERFWQQYWASARIYEFSLYADDGGADVPAGEEAGTEAHPTRRLRAREEIFSIDTPPPTVSGSLHIGHVYSYTQTDMSARYQRMRGKQVYYPFGFDDNGLPTERLVEREKGLKAHEYIKEHGREAFIALCREVVEKYEAQFVALWQSLALSCDWKQFYTTIGTIRDGEYEDKDLARAISQASFIDLYRRQVAYRDEAPTLWCWADQTAISQAEIEDREVPGFFHDIKFSWTGGHGQSPLGELVIATTRPELIPACVAVMVNPDDTRLVPGQDGMQIRELVGKIAITPLFGVEVPILPSEKVQVDKGTGILMCCTFGDIDDVEHWQKEWPEELVEDGHLNRRIVVTRKGTIDDLTSKVLGLVEAKAQIRKEIAEWEADAEKHGGSIHPDDIASAPHSKLRWKALFSLISRTPLLAKLAAALVANQPIKKARVLIAELLSETGLLVGKQEIVHTVRHSERGGVPIEIIVTPQWYVKIKSHKNELLEQGRKVRWHPEYMLKRYEQWVEGLNADWCVSRQRFNGIPFPVWYAPSPIGMPNNDECILARTDDLPVNPPASMPEFTNNLVRSYASRSIIEIETDDFMGEVQTWKPEDVKPDPDVMDTWATSSVTPLLNTHRLPGVEKEIDPEAWAKFHQDEAKQRHSRLFPFDMRPQAHDIIRTWAFYTIAKAYFHFGEIPWKDIVISGHAQDAARQKMSKSKGNVVTPAELVEKYSADGIRYWSGSCKLGTDTVYDEKTLGEGRKLINKLFNATKFALRHLIGFDPVGAGLVPPSAGGADALAKGEASLAPTGEDGRSIAPPLPDCIPYPTDRWLLARLNSAIERATRAHDAFDFADAKQAAEDFFWADFCDNYLELSKGRLYGEPLAVEAHSSVAQATPPASVAGWHGGPPHQYTPEELKLSAQATLYLALSSILRLFAPVLPHITEECWSWYFAQFSQKRSIHEEAWPEPVGAGLIPLYADAGSEGGTSAAPTADAPGGVPTGNPEAELLLATLLAVRKAKSEAGVSIKKPVAKLSIYRTEHAPEDADGAPVLDGRHLQAILGDLLSTTSSSAAELCAGPAPQGAATTEKNPVAVVCDFAPDAD